MSRPRSAGSIFWGLILIIAGSIFLLRNLGYEVPVWTGIARYWPVLLIVWGLIKLIDYARWKRAGETGPLFGAGEVVLLIVVIMAGSALTAAANMSPDLGYLFEMANVDLWDITGNSYEYSEHYEKDVKAGSSIQVFNRYGNIDIVPSDKDRIVVDVTKTIIATNQKDADDLAKTFNYAIQDGDNGGYLIISNLNRDQHRVRGRRFKTTLRVAVPKRAALNIDNRNGNVELNGITGDQYVSNAFGRVSMNRITGDVKVDSRNDTVTLEEITGSVRISNEFSGVEVKKVSGSLEIKHHNGSVDVDDVKGETKISNAFGSVNAMNIHGGLTIDTRMTSVDVTRADSDVNVDGQFQSVKLDAVRGSVTVNNRNGSVEVRYDQPPTRNARVTSQFGDVTMFVPSSSAFSLDARTRFGSVSSDFRELGQSSHSDRSSLAGQVGSGGPEIRIENRNGSIYIEK